MKFKSTLLSLSILCFFAISFQANAFTPTNQVTSEQEISKTIETYTTVLDKKKGAKRFLKVKAKAAKFISKAAEKLDIDLKDPIRKWLWYGLIALGAAVILYVLAALLTSSIVYWIAYLASVGSSVCFLIWLLKYLDVM